jgi:hypothetical protein
LPETPPPVSSAHTAKDDIRSNPSQDTEHALVEIEVRLSQLISEGLHRYAADIDAHLSEHISQAIHHNITHVNAHLSEHISQAIHHNITHVNAHLSEHISAEVNRHISSINTHLSEHISTEVHRHMAYVDAHLSDHLTREVSLHLGTGDSKVTKISSAEIRDRIVSLARLLTPCSTKESKVRVGSDIDGGYVLLNDFSRVRSALSFGVGQEMTWDLELAGKGICVHQFDHTIDAPPTEHDLITFYRRRIAPSKDDRSESLASALELTNSQPCIVKMDIEGDEWDVLDTADSGCFKTITQFVCEFHEFDRIDEAAWYARALRVLTKLQGTFAVVHVHANNYGLLRTRGNVAFPDILEVTFANRDCYKLLPSDEIFPTKLDAANRPDLPDIFLGAFRF